MLSSIVPDRLNQDVTGSYSNGHSTWHCRWCFASFKGWHVVIKPIMLNVEQ